MKSSQLEESGKVLDEIILILNKSEISVLYEALKEYCELHKKNKKAKSFLNSFESSAIF